MNVNDQHFMKEIEDLIAINLIKQNIMRAWIVPLKGY
jgi:hypothetical protein